jgi:hypothetical protein
VAGMMIGCYALENLSSYLGAKAQTSELAMRPEAKASGHLILGAPEFDRGKRRSRIGR